MSKLLIIQEFSFQTCILIAISILIMILTTLLINIALNGKDMLSLNLITNYPSANASNAGMRSAILGSLYTVSSAILIALPLGIATGLYLNEYGGKSRIASIINMALVNLAGVPSIIFGLVALSFLSSTIGYGRSILAGSIALAFLVLPLIVVATIESARLIPSYHRFAAYALGAKKYQVVFRVIFPRILPSALTSSILAISRAMGEAAPILIISGLIFIRRDPVSLLDQFTVMPLQIFNWISRPQEAFIELSAAGIIVLLIILLSLNVVAIYMRNKIQRVVAE